MASPTERPEHGDRPTVPVAPARHRTDELSRDPADTPPDASEDEEEEHHGPLHFLRELPGLILIALVLALLIKTFLVQAFYIPSESMVPTLRNGDRVLVNKLIFNIRDPDRGEIVVFE
ncbi:MAG TPA: signal peptidase I, partial [Actinomycetota bacterium]